MEIGAQLYTVRDYCQNLEDFSETLKKVSDIGYRYVQVSGTCDFDANWLKNEEVYKNFVALFVVNFKPYDTQEIGIWETTNQPVLLRKEVWNKDFSSRYSLIKNMSYEEVRNYAKQSANISSISAKHFFEINATNWEILFDGALGEEHKDYKIKNRYDYLTLQDIGYNVNKT